MGLSFLWGGENQPVARIRCVLFDLDGTLIDTNGLIIRSFQHTLRCELGLEISPEQITPFFGEPLAQTLARFAPPERVEQAVATYRAFNRQQHDQLSRPIPGMVETLRFLQALGIKLGVTTSKQTATAWRGLRLFGLHRYVSAVVGMDQCQQHKPHPEPVLRTLAGLGEEPGPDCLMVGDSPFDVAAGRAAGLTTVAVRWSALPPDQLAASQPDCWVETPADLMALCREG